MKFKTFAEKRPIEAAIFVLAIILAANEAVLHRRKVAAAMRGKLKSPEHRAKISEAAKKRHRQRNSLGQFS